MFNMTLYLPPHQENQFKYILEGVPCSQKRISVDKWHHILGELCFMDIKLPGSRGIFSHT